MQEPTGLRHPPWCASASHCYADGVHTGHGIRVEPTDGDTAAFMAFLEQSIRPANAPVRVVLRAVDEGEAADHFMSVDQTRVLIFRLRRLLREAAQ